MAKKKKKIKDKCCEKYLKSGKHCKDCPLLVKGKPKKKDARDGKEKTKKKKDKQKAKKKAKK